MIVVNAAWQGQRTTGQQRYASEVTRRLLTHPGVVARPVRISTNRWLAWTQVQGLSLWGRDEVLITLTSRGPALHRCHVVVVHDHFVLSNPEWYSPKYVVTHAPVLKAQIRGASGLVFVSEATRSRHIALFGDETPSVIAPNGVTAPALETVRPWPLGRPYLLAVASTDPRKNLDRLIQAYSSLPSDARRQCSLVVVGGTNSTVFAASQHLIDESDGILSLGYVTDDELWSLYRGARAVVVPSLDEGFGLPLIEAAALGAPLVVSDIPVFRWIAAERAVYFDPKDVESIRDSLRRVVSDDVVPVDPAAVRSRFGWDHTAQKILDLSRRLEGAE
ncbi:glycosyltransferase family 4 protein [Ornithinimicrobium cerasi]|uniref:glycosyltransferase family 4 protein n=1 Tax=Ornithinimicrobium cerasi TaxID=2248773 RepID=UPI000EFDE362|nr:glycosyltransferase family 1 protein [Ornithinimicrobium cerasi]